MKEGAARKAGTGSQSRIRLHEPADEVGDRGLGWLINGYPAAVLVWTAEQWARLVDRPDDARWHPSGVWVALRME